ncbi:hypothetical protein [Candidatus Tisiphia endosymbiont of Metellina segmentata]|uniref:hypothetical protein n=1 Tax=Candidatus Tisiphia endosymbiont of Metellina segmentata TaxID=3066274 RepID=UPI00313BAE9C
MIRKFCPDSIKEVISECIKYICQSKGNYDLIHIDRKTLRGSNTYGTGEQVQILTSFSSQLKALTGFREIENKDEYKSMFEFLSNYDMQGKIVTSDASFTHEAICEKIVEQGGEFELTLKANEANLHYHSTQTFDKIQVEGQEIKSFAENIDL